MSRFYFNTSTISGIAASLESVKDNLESNKEKINTVSDILFINEGFNIKNIVDSLRKQGTDIDLIKTQLSDGQNVIREITGLTDSYANAAYTAMDKLSGTTAGAINNVTNIIQDLAKNTGKGSVSDTAPSTEDVLSKYPEGSWIQGDKVYIPNNSNTFKIVDQETGGKKYTVLIPVTENFFEKGSYHGYIQIAKNGGWFQSDYQCVATAFATTDKYNGLDTTPYNRYSHGDYSGGYAGWGTGANWSPYGGMDAQQFLDYCTSRLDNGLATTIYSHHDFSHDSGHALTVVGYVPTSSEPSMYDLIVVDPWNGGKFRLGDTSYVNHNNNKYNGYFTVNY